MVEAMPGPGGEHPVGRPGEFAGGPSLANSVWTSVLGAAVRTSARPPRSLQPSAPRSSRRMRVLLVLPWIVLALGFGGGAIGQLIVNMRVDPALGWLLGLLQCAPLLVARRWPLAAWRVMVAGLLLGEPAVVGVRPELSWPWPVTSCLALMLVLFWLAASYERQTAFGVGVVTALAVVGPAVLISGMSPWLALILVGVVALVLVFGDAVGGRYAAEASLAAQTELRRADLARQAVLEERARIARELHDVVAHHMSVIALQAEAAPYKMPDLPPEARGTFATIRTAAVEALAETRRVVGLLRADSEAPERAPQPGLDRLPELLERGRQAGLRVSEPIVVGIPRPLATGVDLSAYRIVQEALSNAARYAPGSRVGVEVGYREDGLFMAVRNEAGATPAAPADPAGGHGLVGMRERVSMLGGTLSAEPVSGDGFAVTATLPYGEPATGDTARRDTTGEQGAAGQKGKTAG